MVMYCSKKLLSDIHWLTISLCDSVSHLLMVQTSKGKVAHTYNELIKAPALKL